MPGPSLRTGPSVVDNSSKTDRVGNSLGRATIITCAVTGNITTRAQHPGLPITPASIATAALEAERAGAAVVHIHARDPQTEKGSRETDYFAEIVSRIRDAGSSIVLNLSTGEGGRFVPSQEDPSVGGPGTTLVRPELRVAHVEALKPEICSLDLNTMYSGSAVVINTPESVEVMANRIYEAGVVPELELFGIGDLQLAKHLLGKGVLRAPALFQLVLGVRFGAPADPQTLLHLTSQLPPGSQWTAFGIGRAEFPMVAQAWLLGGHVRVGLEDNVFISEGVLARNNAHLVEKAVDIVQSLGGSIATPDEARAILGLRRPSIHARPRTDQGSWVHTMALTEVGENLLDPTPEESIGPYYPLAFLDGEPKDLSKPQDGMVVAPIGLPIVLSGRVLDVSGEPVDLALLEFWQADSNGELRLPANSRSSAVDPWFVGLARQYCRSGTFELKTIMPGRALWGEGSQQRRAPHITVTLFCDGINRLVTQVFFEGEPGNNHDPLLESVPPHLRSRLVASRHGEDGLVRRYQWDIVLRGDAETPFFDDLES